MNKFFNFCDSERMKSVNRLIELIIKSNKTTSQKSELKNDLKKISSIRCQNIIESLNLNVEEVNKTLEASVQDTSEKQYIILKDSIKNSSSQKPSDIISKQQQQNIDKNISFLISPTHNEIYEIFVFDDESNDDETFYEFFDRNNLLNDDNLNYIFKISNIQLNIKIYIYIYYDKNNKIYKIYRIDKKDDNDNIFGLTDLTTSKISDIIFMSGHEDRYWYNNLKIPKNIFRTKKAYDLLSENLFEEDSTQYVGGYAKSSKFKTKEVLGKLRRIYKIPNSKKEHIKHKGNLITVSEYKALMKLKNKK
jgi:hypothetical protein